MAGIWNIGGTGNYDADQAERQAAFAKIAPAAGGWKAPIDCWISADDFAACDNAAIWFTGGSLEVVKASGDQLHVRSGGYYQNVGEAPAAAYTIIREGLFFRAINSATGEASKLFTSASQAGLYIERRAGRDAHMDAILAWVAAAEKKGAA